MESVFAENNVKRKLKPLEFESRNEIVKSVISRLGPVLYQDQTNDFEDYRNLPVRVLKGFLYKGGFS